MKITHKSLISVAVVSTALALGACGKKDEPMPTPTPAPAPAPAPQVTPPPVAAPAPGVTLTSVTLGNAVDANNNVTMPADSFGSKDTIHASVATIGSAASTTVSAKWLYNGSQVVNESTQTIAPTGPAVTEFHIEKADGWPLGDYAVEISIDGHVVDTKKFTVK